MRINKLLLTAILVVGCGGGDKSPTAPSAIVPLPTPVVLVSVVVSGETTLVAGTTGKYHALARYSDGAITDVTGPATFKSSAPSVASVIPGGMLIPGRLGTLQLSASFSGMTGTLSVRVVGTPWRDLTKISEAQKAWIKSFVLSQNGMLWRWAGGVTPISVWTSASFSRQKIDSVLTLWTTATEGSFKFVVVADSAKSMIQYTNDLSAFPPNQCGWGGATKVENGVFLAGIVRVSASCAGDTFILAHEFGHTLGFLGHTPPGDIMSVDEGVFGMSPFLLGIVNWVRTVPPATIPIEP